MTAMMALAYLLANYRDGDEHGWDAEFDYLWSREPDYMDRLSASIQKEGMREPILLGGDGRVWNGHHRLAAAKSLGFVSVPVRHVDPVLASPGTAPTHIREGDGQ